MAVLSVFEHQRVRVTDRPCAGQLSILPTQAAGLQKLEGSIPKGAFVWGHESVKFSQFCGVITIGADTIEVLPKIHGKEDSPGVCRELLVRMLYAARRFKFASCGRANLNLQKYDLLEIYILQFCGELLLQLRQGMMQGYVARTENLPVVRGKFLIDQQLRLNHCHRERMWCQHDELTADNQLNRIIKCVLRLLLSIARSPKARKSVTDLLYRFEGVGDVHIQTADVDAVRLDRTNRRFEATFEFCRWVLNGVSPDVISGTNTGLALLFDMNRLFEEVLAVKVRSVVWREGLRLRTQGPRRRFARNRATGVDSFGMKPDISLLGDDGDVAAILDAKWKVLDASEKKMGISQADVYQMASYAARYDCRELALVYPRTGGVPGGNSVEFELLGAAATLRVCPVDLDSMLNSKKGNRWENPLLPTISAAASAVRSRASIKSA